MATQDKVIGIVGSYRRGGVVDTAVDEILAAAGSRGMATEKIFLLDRHIEFCHNCRVCMQQPGEARGKCVINDEMEQILTAIDGVRYLVIGAPVNAGNVNALTRRFLERCAGFAYWPWGAPWPKVRRRKLTRRAVLVSSSAMPALLGRWFTGALGALKLIARVLGARPVGVLWIGQVNDEDARLSASQVAKAHKLGRRLIPA